MGAEGLEGSNKCIVEISYYVLHLKFAIFLKMIVYIRGKYFSWLFCCWNEMT